MTVQQNPSFADIRGRIDTGRPVVLFRFWHPIAGADLVFGYSD